MHQFGYGPAGRRTTIQIEAEKAASLTSPRA
jgi:hypothetical protein